MIKEQLKQENQRKLFDKSLFITIRPEFNNGGAIEAVAIVLLTFLYGAPFVSKLFFWVDPQLFAFVVCLV